MNALILVSSKLNFHRVAVLCIATKHDWQLDCATIRNLSACYPKFSGLVWLCEESFDQSVLLLPPMPNNSHGATQLSAYLVSSLPDIASIRWSLQLKVVTGVGWIASANLLHHLITRSVTIVIMRLLSPADFG